MILACLQIYRELLSLVTFLRVHSNSEEVSYLSWQSTYPNLKTTRHIKLKCFLWTKLLENLILSKYFICRCAFNIYKQYFFNSEHSYCTRVKLAASDRHHQLPKLLSINSKNSEFCLHHWRNRYNYPLTHLSSYNSLD